MNECDIIRDTVNYARVLLHYSHYVTITGLGGPPNQQVLIGKSAADNDRLSLDLGRADEAFGVLCFGFHAVLSFSAYKGRRVYCRLDLSGLAVQSHGRGIPCSFCEWFHYCVKWGGVAKSRLYISMSQTGSMCVYKLWDSGKTARCARIQSVEGHVKCSVQCAALSLGNVKLTGVREA